MSTRDAKRATMDFQLLSRARNLFTLADPTELGNSGEDDNRSLQSNNAFGSSIKKKLKEVKAASLQRSRSISSRFAPNSERKSLECPPQGSSGPGDTPPQVVHPSTASGSLPIAAGTNGSGDGALPSTPEPLSPVSHRPQPQQPIEQQPAMDITVPALLQTGTPMTKVTANKQKKVVLRLDADQGEIVWESKKHRIIPIEQIRELRVGADARFYREQFQLSQDYEDRWLTIIYVLEGEYKTLHLIATSKDVFQMWDSTLRKLYAVRQELMSGLGNLEVKQAVWEKQYWKGADEESDQKLDFDEAERLCKRLNISTAPEDLRRLFKQADTNNNGYLDFNAFRRFVKLLKARPDMQQIYDKICKAHNGRFDFPAFGSFMLTIQKSTLSQAELHALFDRYAAIAVSTSSSDASSTATAKPPAPTLHQERQDTKSTQPPPADQAIAPGTPPTILSQEGFNAFLLSTDNSAFTDQPKRIWHDMTRPLSEYFISSSHNTYLVGNQLMGVSTIEGYIRALLHGCRSVELDIYDGDTEPMVFHGKTLTSKVSVRDICKAIAKYAFVASPYPVIISAEVHCGLAQQEMMAKIMNEVFGTAIVSAPVDGRARIEALPSPEDLKGKILLKAKNVYVVAEQEALRGKDSVIDSESDSDAAQDVKFHRRKSSGPVKELKHEFAKARNVVDRVRGIAPTPPPQASPLPPTPPQKSDRPPVKMSLALVAMLVYTVGVKCRGLNKKEEYAPEHVFSLSENTANKFLKQDMVDLIKHTRSHIIRIYPKGLRLNSTNYEPHRFWAAGAQLVAINWQTCDLGYMINHAMFQRNGRSGYVLKPLALRTPDKDLLAKRTQHFLDVTVISAQQVPRPRDSSGREIIGKSIVDPYVEVSLHIPDWSPSPFLPTTTTPTTYSPPSGATPISHTSARTVSHKTGVVKNNGFNPVWQEGMHLPFDCIGGMKELVFVRFAIRQEESVDAEPLAVYCASLGSLQQGYHHLPLHDAQMSQFLFSTLFVHIDIRDAESKSSP